jgi:hypothetical protein
MRIRSGKSWSLCLSLVGVVSLQLHALPLAAAASDEPGERASVLPPQADGSMTLGVTSNLCSIGAVVQFCFDSLHQGRFVVLI